ncbi:MAG TPA: hypothetical protein VGB17_16300 [Pyrinomonadaceae bacterium]
MKKLLIASLLLACAFALAVHAQGQADAQKPTGTGITTAGVIGEVTLINSSANQMTVKTDSGALVAVMLSQSTKYMRLAPGEKTLDKATTIALADVGVGDRVWARGRIAEDQKSIPASAVIVMTKADLTKKQEREREEWNRRGILGVVSAVNPATKEITIQSRAAQGTQPVIITTSDKVEFRRYAPDSIKFGDARPSSFAELRQGDQLRALGNKSPDGTHFTPEIVVTGSFRTVGGTVTAINAATGEVKINDLQNKQPLTVVIRPDSQLRRIPSDRAAAIGARLAGGGPGGPGPVGPGGAPAAGGPQGQGAGGPGGARRGFDFQEILETLPNINVAELKVGDMIIVSSTTGAEPTRVTAISLVAGVEPLLQALQARQQPQQGGRPAQNPANGLGTGINFGIGLP